MRLWIVGIGFMLAVEPVHALEDCPTMDEFMTELIVPTPTGRTPDFVTYCGFSVMTGHIIREFDRRARRSGLEPLGIIVVGPHGDMYSYHVLSFVREGETVRVNLTVNVHDRIRYKGTAVLTKPAFRQYRESLLRYSYLSKANAPCTGEDGCTDEFDTMVLWQDLTRTQPVLRIGRTRPERWPGTGHDDVFERIVTPLEPLFARTY